MKEVQLVIPMAGDSKLFNDAGYVGPKWLIEIDGKSMIQHVVDQFSGVTDVLFICREEDSQHQPYLESLGGKVVKVNQSTGPVDTILQSSEHIADDKEVVVSYCDHGMAWGFSSFVDEARQGNYEGAMTCYRKFHPHLLASKNLYTYCLTKDNNLLEVQDKQAHTEEREGQFISSDVFYFKSGSLLKEYFNKSLNNLSMNGFVSPVYNLLVEDGLSVHIHEIERMLLWATPEDLKNYKDWSNYFNRDRSNRAGEQDFTVLIPMCGKGSRFAKEGYQLPKPLLPIDNLPMFAGVVNCLPKHQDNVFVCSEEHNAEVIIKSYYPQAKIKSINYVTEGFAESCEVGIGLMNEEDPLLISPCDNGVSYDEESFLRMIADDSNDVIFWVVKGSQAPQVNPSMYTWTYVDEDGCVEDMVYKEKPETDLATTPISIGIMYFRKARYLLEGLRLNRERGMRPTGELCMDSVAHQLTRSGYKVKVFEAEHYACWGTPGDYETYNHWRKHFK